MIERAVAHAAAHGLRLPITLWRFVALPPGARDRSGEAAECFPGVGDVVRITIVDSEHPDYLPSLALHELQHAHDYRAGVNLTHTREQLEERANRFAWMAMADWQW